MKSLTIKQPWAELILRGKKKIELRKWNTKFRGEFLIHSSKDPDEMAMKNFGFEILPNGYILGKINLEDVKEYPNGDSLLKDKKLHLADDGWGNYGFILKNPKRINKIPYRGQLGFWNFEGETIEAKLIESEDEIKKVCDYLMSLNLDYPDYNQWVEKCKRELISGYKKGFYMGNQQISGVVIFQPHKEQKDILEIKNFSVSPKFEKKGLGSVLFDSLEDYFREALFKRMIVDAHAENYKIINFFKHRGFKIIKKDSLYSASQIEIVLQKEK